MRNINWFVDTAKERLGYTSDAKFAREVLNITSASISNWRTGKAYPAEAHMVILAPICDIQEEVALLELQVWKNTNNVSGPIFKRALDVITKTAACLVFILALFGGTPDGGALAKGENMTGTSQHHSDRNLYYVELKNILTRCKQWLSNMFTWQKAPQACLTTI